MVGRRSYCLLFSNRRRYGIEKRIGYWIVKPIRLVLFSLFTGIPLGVWVVSKQELAWKMKKNRKSGRCFDRVINYLAGAGATLIFGMMFIVSLEVVMRYILHRPQIWVVEVGEYILVWLTFLGAAWILREEGHVKVDILYDHFGPKLQAFFGIVSSLLGMFVCLIFLVYGSQVVWDMCKGWELDPRSQIGMPKGPLLIIIPLCSLPLFIQFARRGHRSITDWRSMRKREHKE